MRSGESREFPDPLSTVRTPKPVKRAVVAGTLMASVFALLAAWTKTSWPSTKARKVLSAHYRIGWTLRRQSCSHKTLSRSG